MRIVVTGGGTGGHIYPAIAIAEKFKKENKDCQVLYIGSMHGIEKDLVPKLGYDIKLVDAMGVNRSNPIKLVSTLMHVAKGVGEAKKVIKDFKPDYIIGTGGYVCFPSIYSGSKLGIPCYLHEQNAFPGLANKKLEKHVKKIFLGFENARKYFKDKDKILYAGNPVRENFFKMTKEEARKKLGYSNDETIILSFGGSLGAEKINEASIELLKKINGKEGYRLIFGTGKRYYDEILAKVKQLDLKQNIEIKDYINDMDNYLMASDLVIERAGALSVAETTVCGKPSILIPSPNVTNNHQFFNAKAVSDLGGAMLVEEKDLDNSKFADTVFELISDKKKLEEMAKCAKECAPTKALDIIYSGIAK